MFNSIISNQKTTTTIHIIQQIKNRLVIIRLLDGSIHSLKRKLLIHLCFNSIEFITHIQVVVNTS